MSNPLQFRKIVQIAPPDRTATIYRHIPQLRQDRRLLPAVPGGRRRRAWPRMMVSEHRNQSAGGGQAGGGLEDACQRERLSGQAKILAPHAVIGGHAQT